MVVGSEEEVTLSQGFISFSGIEAYKIAKQIRHLLIINQKFIL